MKNFGIASLAEQRLKKFEKEIRRHLKTVPEFEVTIDGVNHVSSTYHIYLFKQTLDHMHDSCTEPGRLPLQEIILYGNIFTLRSLKSGQYETKSEYMEEEFDHIFNNHEVLAIWVYDAKFAHKPQKSIFQILCAINKKKRGIFPMQFTVDLSALYPNWFDSPLKQRNHVEVGVDFELVDMIKKVLE